MTNSTHSECETIKNFLKWKKAYPWQESNPWSLDYTIKLQECNIFQFIDTGSGNIDIFFVMVNTQTVNCAKAIAAISNMNSCSWNN